MSWRVIALIVAAVFSLLACSSSSDTTKLGSKTPSASAQAPVTTPSKAKDKNTQVSPSSIPTIGTATARPQVSDSTDEPSKETTVTVSSEKKQEVKTPGASATAAAAPACVDVEGVGIRGSEEPPQGDAVKGAKPNDVQNMGELAAAKAYRAFADQLPEGVSVRPHAILYPAVPINWENIKPGEPRWGLPPYEENLLERSVVTGVEMLKKHISAVVKQCPSTRFAVIAYSQGAWVVQNYLSFLDSTGDPAKIKPRLRVLLFGDPRFDSTDTAAFDQGDSRHPYGGVISRTKIPVGISARSYCATGDPVCNAKIGNIGSLKAHEQYARKDKLKLEGLSYAQHGADWLASRFNASNVVIKDVLTLDSEGNETKQFGCSDKKIRLAAVVKNDFGHSVNPTITFDSYTDKTVKPTIPNGTYRVSTLVDVPKRSGEYLLEVTVSYQDKTNKGEKHYFTYVCWDN